MKVKKVTNMFEEKLKIRSIVELSPTKAKTLMKRSIPKHQTVQVTDNLRSRLSPKKKLIKGQEESELNLVDTRNVSNKRKRQTSINIKNGKAKTEKDVSIEKPSQAMEASSNTARSRIIVRKAAKRKLSPWSKVCKRDIYNTENVKTKHKASIDASKQNAENDGLNLRNAARKKLAEKKIRIINNTNRPKHSHGTEKTKRKIRTILPEQCERNGSFEESDNSKGNISTNVTPDKKFNENIINSRKSIKNSIKSATNSTKLRKQAKRQTTNAQSTKNGNEPTDMYMKDLSKNHILQCINAIFHLTQEELKSTNNLFSNGVQPIFMQVTCIRIPKTPRRNIRMLLPHSIFSEDDEIALFVPDLEKGRRTNYEPTVEHYQELLEKNGCKRIKDVIPMNRVKTEFDQYELKRKLLNSYDHFLADGRIVDHLTHLLGKKFAEKRKAPTAIHINSKRDLNSEIDTALRKTLMVIHSLSDTHLVQIGTTAMKKQDLLENIMSVCEQLCKKYPGGWENIRSLSIKSARTLSIPIYVTLKNKNCVKIPVVQPKRPKAYQDVVDELSTLYDARVIVTPKGDVIVNDDRDHNIQGS